MMNLAVVILAAGKGTRMRSTLPKVLHQIGGRPIVDYSVRLAAGLSPEPPVLVIGHGADEIRAAVGERARYVEQVEQLGTGHAVMQAEAVLKDRADLVLVFFADMPLLTVETLRKVVVAHGQHEGPLTMLSVIAEDPRGFGRIVRGPEGEVLGIVEEVEATPEQRLIRELNVSVYCFDAAWLWPALKRIEPSPQKGEYYLTDTVALANADGYKVVAVVAEDEAEAMGINTRVHLAEAEAVLRRRINETLMLAGVTMIDPARTTIQPEVEVGGDTVLWPGVCLRGRTRIGSNCEIGPQAVLTDVTVGNGCKIGTGVVLEGVVIPADTVIPAENRLP